MTRLKRILTRPETMLGAGVFGLLAAAAVLVNLALASCQSGPGRAPTTQAPTAPARDVGEPEMRVRIAAAIDSLEVSCAAGLQVSPAMVTSTRQTLAGSQPLSVTVRDGVFVLTTPAGELNRLPVSSQLSIMPAGAGAPLVVNGVSYPGRLRLIGRSDASAAAFDVIEFVLLERYLPGVVAKEMPRGWPAEAYRVQAVCARTYAIHERHRALADGRVFDVEATESDQAYAGAQADGPVPEAVRATRGVVINWSGDVLRAYYSSTCGGRSGSARDTWPVKPGYEFNLAAPIQAHQRDSACTDSPLYRWSVTRDRAETVKRLRAFGERQQLLIRRLKDLHSIQIAATNDIGRPSKYKIIEPGGTWYTLSGEELRLAFNTPVPGLPAIERKTRVSSSDFEVAVKGAIVTVSGRGFGHGVGMCQYCARAMAARGEDYRTMLARFYPGSTIQQRY